MRDIEAEASERRTDEAALYRAALQNVLSLHASWPGTHEHYAVRNARMLLRDGVPRTGDHRTLTATELRLLNALSACIQPLKNLLRSTQDADLAWVVMEAEDAFYQARHVGGKQ